MLPGFLCSDLITEYTAVCVMCCIYERGNGVIIVGVQIRQVLGLGDREVSRETRKREKELGR